MLGDPPPADPLPTAGERRHRGGARAPDDALTTDDTGLVGAGLAPPAPDCPPVPNALAVGSAPPTPSLPPPLAGATAPAPDAPPTVSVPPPLTIPARAARLITDPLTVAIFCL